MPHFFYLWMKIFQFELLQAWRNPAAILHGAGFFIIVTTFFPFVLGTDSSLLQSVGAGAIWVGMLISLQLGLPQLLEKDDRDGTMEQWLLIPAALEWIILIKCLSHWLVTTGPVLLLAPLAAMMLGLPAQQVGNLLAALGLGSIIITFIGIVGAALVLGQQRRHVTLMLITLPLYIPVLIFGAAASAAASTIEWSMLWLMLAIMLPAGCALSAWLVRILR